jgi:hypothetical protein
MPSALMPAWPGSRCTYRFTSVTSATPSLIGTSIKRAATAAATGEA